MRPPMLHTIYKIATTRNAYGDFIASSTTAIKGHWRDVSEIITGDNEQIQSDATAWLEADSGVEKEDILRFKGEYYRVMRVTKARRLRSTEVLFLKCDMRKYGQIS